MSVSIAFEQQFPLLKCAGCAAEFVMISVLRETDKDGKPWQSEMLLGAVNFCPFCGGEWVDGRQS